jgi:hypothetical protein
MRQEEKSQKYWSLLNQFDKIGNKIAEIKGQNIDLNQSQINEINMLKTKQNQIMKEVQQMMK